MARPLSSLLRLGHGADQVRIRWMVRRDMPEILAIEQASFEWPWCEDHFVRTLRYRNVIGMVAEIDDRVAGYFIYEMKKTRLHVLNFAVHPDCRRQGVGRRMIEKLFGKLSVSRRRSIFLHVRETNLAGQLFFQRSGFRAVSVLRDFYQETDEDAYLMEYTLARSRSADAAPPVNRI